MALTFFRIANSAAIGATAGMRYPGGKNHSGAFPRIINLIPPHRVYVEPFLGSGAVMRMKRPADVTIGVDRVTPNPALLGICEFIQGDALEWLPRYPWKGDEFVYCDPPYVLSTRTKKRIYRFELSDADHRRLLRILRTIPAKVLLSGYPCPLYDDALADWNRDTFHVFTRAHTWKTEALWFNYPRPAVLHDHAYTGKNFRERWRIEKRRRRLIGRFRKMPELERAALFSALVDVMQEGPDAGDC